VFERFSESARRVIVLAHDEARILRHSYIGTEHILLGLLREEEGLGARVLLSLDVSLEAVRARVVRTMGTGEEAAEGQIPFTPRAVRALEGAHRTALGFGDDPIETEHLLLGLLKSQGVGTKVLEDIGVTADAVHERMVAMIHQSGSLTSPADMGPPRSRAVRLLLDQAAREAAREGASEVELRHVRRALERESPPPDDSP
jgi:ATP-dependent Clp protease ATP-binding subunit ClpC